METDVWDVELDQLGVVVNLEWLDLKGNALTTLDGFPMLDRLTTLDVSDNDLTEVGGLCGLPALAWLSVSDNDLGDLSLSRLPSLGVLDASNNDLTSLSLDHLPLLSTLVLSSNNLAERAHVSVLASSLPGLEELDIRDNDISYDHRLALHAHFASVAPQVTLKVRI